MSGHIQQCRVCASRALESALDLGEQPQANGALRGRGSFLAARNLYAFYTATGDAERAETYRQLSLVPGSTP